MKPYSFLIVMFLSFLLVSGKEYTGFNKVQELNISVNTEFQKNLALEEERSKVTNFLDKMASLESSDNYRAVTGSYYGKYQFGRMALDDIGLKNITLDEFLEDHMLQEQAMIQYLFKNKFYLQRYIDKYVGTTYHGIFITEAGILASAHLGGSSSVKIWFDTGRVFRDGNGTPITKYMKEFEDMSYFNLENEQKVINLVL